MVPEESKCRCNDGMRVVAMVRVNFVLGPAVIFWALTARNFDDARIFARARQRCMPEYINF